MNAHYDQALLPQHAQLMADSGITPVVAQARGYRSVTTKAELKRLGFAESQCLVPALLNPIRGVTGEVVLYQARPDAPRLRNGKTVKYETPPGTQMALDVPPLPAPGWGILDAPSSLRKGPARLTPASPKGCVLSR